MGEGGCSIRKNAAGQDRYYFTEELEQDMEATVNTQNLPGSMKLNAQQWRYTHIIQVSFEHRNMQMGTQCI